ncbi:MAG TPA: hypothetical protein VKZ81_29070 [Pseudonocardia sp.]|uniref:hypothetical protein n=1 Tax=Pseudonocardia sp. TaxID=60912 RepID=UPI002B4B528F|nr:hypothetical protein [Pseudonocardia sp.]HLU59533.1 hypothetical protein [Pseudonocardia sp.]
MTHDPEWQRSFAELALRLNPHLGGAALLYHGPPEWSARIEGEEPRPVGALAADAARLLERDLAPDQRATVGAMRAVARFLDGRLGFRDLAAQVTGLEPRWVPESVFARAHDRLAAALPAGSGPLADRWHAWQRAHALADTGRIPALVEKAVAETRARTAAIVALPPDEVVECTLVPEAHFHFAGLYRGGVRSTIFVNTSVPFVVADLLYAVAHEGHPGHIAEALVKVRGATRTDQRVRFLFSPPFALGEGLGLCAEEIVFPGDEAQRWLADTVHPDVGVERDGSDLAAIHLARNELWGVWANAALMAADGRPERELADYLARWALLDDAEIAKAVPMVRPSPMSAYVIGYFHAWELLRPWLRDRANVRLLLTEHLLPGDIR